MASGRVPKLMKSVRTLDSAPYRHVGPLPLGDFGLMIAYQPVVFPVSRAASNRGILARRLQDNRGPAARNAPPAWCKKLFLLNKALHGDSRTHANRPNSPFGGCS